MKNEMNEEIISIVSSEQINDLLLDIKSKRFKNKIKECFKNNKNSKYFYIDFYCEIFWPTTKKEIIKGYKEWKN